MTKVHYCETNYSHEPPIDVNPLIWQAYPKGKILILCAREGMKKRIKSLQKENIDIVGWWELDKYNLVIYNCLNREKLLSYTTVVIIGRNRIHEIYRKLLNLVETILNVRHIAT